MTDQEDQEIIIHEESQDSGWVSSDANHNVDDRVEDQANPLVMVLDRMHGRWLWAILLGIVLAPALSYLGWKLTPVKYMVRSHIEFVSVLPALVADTFETSRRETEMEAKVLEVYDHNVIQEALADPELANYVSADRYAEFAQDVYEGLAVSVPKRSQIVVVSYESQDRDLPHRVVGSVLRAYGKIKEPDSDVEFRKKRDRIEDLATKTENTIDDLDEQRRILFANNRYGISEVASIIESNTTQIRELEIERLEVEKYINTITRLLRQDGIEPDAANSEHRIHPTDDDLRGLEPMYELTRQQEKNMQLQLKSYQERFAAGHQVLRRLKSQAEAKTQEFTALAMNAKSAWLQGPGKSLTYPELTNRLIEIEDKSRALRGINAELSQQQYEADKIDSRLTREKSKLTDYERRLTEIENETESVKEGRVRIKDKGLGAPLAPEKDRRALMAVSGAFGGFGVSFALFFVLGSFDKKTFGVRQLGDHNNRLRTLGVMPNMNEVDKSPETVNLATDCIHRIRARIEARRSPEPGYALMVSSPFQGDGKTTLAVSLGWSYAESGYKTLLIDADFIGRAMTHQFGKLRDPGLREIVRSGKMNGEVVELGHPNLNLLGVGFDRRVSAANLNPTVLRKVINTLRDDFDMIILDTGPLTASIEALPVASVADGVALSLRRGRSRARITDCIHDIRGVGTDYLGVVLNYANRGDCMKYGSTSRTSMEVISALESAGTEALPSGSHPLLGKISDGD